MALENVGSFQYLMDKIKRYKKKHDLSLKKKKKKKKFEGPQFFKPEAQVSLEIFGLYFDPWFEMKLSLTHFCAHILLFYKCKKGLGF